LDKVTSCLDANGCMDIVFIDLAKAFDNQSINQSNTTISNAP